MCQVVDEYKLLSTIGLRGWRMLEGDGAVFRVGELDCEIQHVPLQPCHSVFPGVPLLQTEPVYGDAQRGKKSPVAQTKILEKLQGEG